ncbi:ABC transporter permease [Flavobacterium columnare]|nr:ABC transporter permease [Flavobacterium columnare]
MNNIEEVIEIQNFLPHRAPMLMVDYILNLSETTVKTIFEIKSDNVFIQNALFVEAGMVENAAQTCSAIVGQTFFVDENQQIKENVKVIGFISGIKKIQLFDLPRVDQTIITEAQLKSRFDSDGYCICTMDCKSYSDDIQLLEAEINLFIQQTD